MSVGGSVTSANIMGVRAVGRALKQARGRLSQKAAADRWGVPVATLAALEQGIARHYQAQTLAQFDVMLGRSTLDLYLQNDDDGFTIAEIRRELDELRADVQVLRSMYGTTDQLSALVATLTARERKLVLDLIRSLHSELDNAS